MVMKCNCNSPFQDSQYGEYMRAFNPMAGGEKVKCTVCGIEKSKGSSDDSKKKKSK